MAYRVQASFSAGELDPALWERTTLEKYRTGLKTLRNATIGKTGRIISDPGTKLQIATRQVTTAVGTFTANASDLCTKAGHFMANGAPVVLTTTGTLPAGLALATTYYVIYIDENTFALASTLANAMISWPIDITGAGTGVHTITPTDVGLHSKALLYVPKYSPYILEIGHCYFKIHNPGAGTTTIGQGHGFTEADLPYLQITTNGVYTYIARFGKPFRKIVTATGVLLPFTMTAPGGVLGTTAAQATVFIPHWPTFVSKSTSATGYLVDYVFTYVDARGQESDISNTFTGEKLPINAGEANTVVYSTNANSTNTELRAYRRPKDGQAFGYIGSGFSQALSGGLYQFTFTDYGQGADYTHTPPSAVVSRKDIDPTLSFALVTNPTYVDYVNVLSPRALIVYQQRLCLSSFYNEEAIYTSRTEFQWDFYRDFPYSSNSALAFKCGTSENARILRFMDSSGLLAFTTNGVYRNQGPLSNANCTMDRVGTGIIDYTVPPLEVPGGVLYVDKTTNSIRSLQFSTEGAGYQGDEVSIYSAHLFQGKRVVSWAFQDGDTPLVWVVLNDGSLNALTWQKEQQMQAWSRHDTDGLYECVVTLKDLDNPAVIYFIINRGGTRYIEYLTPRLVADLKDYVGMHATVSYKTLLTGTCVVTPVVPNTWNGSLTLTASVASFANTAGNGAVGSVFKFFDADKTSYLLTVTAYTDTTHVTVTPDSTFPSGEATVAQLYKTFTVLTGLDHLNGKSVSVLADGYVAASPNNVLDSLGIITVTAGSITLPPAYANSAIVQVGLPYTCDIETLDIDTVEQKPTLLESILASRIFIALYKSRGLYAAANFPADDTNTDMVDLEARLADIVEDVLGNMCQQPYTRREEFDVPGDWKSHGRMAFRQVDPLPVEILSIIPDLEVYRS